MTILSSSFRSLAAAFIRSVNVVWIKRLLVSMCNIVVEVELRSKFRGGVEYLAGWERNEERKLLSGRSSERKEKKTGKSSRKRRQ